jgi:predicted SAM-dependent methyltransferase
MNLSVLSRISFRRPLGSYSSVQKLFGNVIRNKPSQLRGERIKGLRYLDIGCGPNTHEEFVNVDYLWHPKVDVCWDITKGIPFGSKSMKGIFTEHCLEHFPLWQTSVILKECLRVLEPGGVLRIVVPDGGMYLERYHEHMVSECPLPFPYQEHESYEGIFVPMLSVNRIFYQDRESMFGHRCMYDFRLLELILNRLGFCSVVKLAYRQGQDSSLLIDTPSRHCESLYVEAIAPSN